eukprot:TRINITY_DN4554_c0_g3_i1.p1 TRINITY_DN4554_c0_g3~~TRINITY_DN4554_c0_g3_i1.p1  ORF type:complete len:534 (+),score=89.38 TRINITY_DN4554_c0_g3_i1:98-1699(+)
MGIQGLLPALKAKSRKCNIQEFKGFRVAIDGYSWLHKSCFSCAYELSVGVPTALYLKSFLNKIQILVNAGIIPVVVFDGADIPLKGNTNDGRQERREGAQEKAKKLLAAGERLKAIEQYQRALDITGEIALSVIKVLRSNNIEVQVAPYEADSQLAYLAMSNYAHVVITEDSDLLPFGAPRVLYKVDYQSGVGDLFLQQDVLKIAEPPLTSDQFLRMCVLSGCDYLKSVKGVGVKKALTWCTLDNDALALSIANHAKELLTAEEIAEYIEKVLVSEIAFKHQRILNYEKCCLDHVTAPPEHLTTKANFDQIVGPAWDPDVVKGVLNLSIDPTTMSPYCGTHDSNIKSVPESALKIKKANNQTRQLSLLSFVKRKSITKVATSASKKPPLHPSDSKGKVVKLEVGEGAVEDDVDEVPRRVVRSRFFVEFKSKRSLYEDEVDDKTALARMNLFTEGFAPDDDTSISLVSDSDEVDSETDAPSTPVVKRPKAEQFVETSPTSPVSVTEVSSVSVSTPPVVKREKRNPFLAFVNKKG